MVAMVHSETTSGIINNVQEVGKMCKARGDRLFFVDAMSSFGATEELNMSKIGISFLVSSSNKCIEGIPGFSYVLANTSNLMQAKGNARTVVLDLVEQRCGMLCRGMLCVLPPPQKFRFFLLFTFDREVLDATKQFRFTPPTHSMLAFDQVYLNFCYSCAAESLFFCRRRFMNWNKRVVSLRGFVVTKKTKEYASMG